MTNFRPQAEDRTPGIHRCTPESVWTVPLPEANILSSSLRVKEEDNIKMDLKKLKAGFIGPKAMFSRKLFFFSVCYLSTQ
jgi:hypothetical protein